MSVTFRIEGRYGEGDPFLNVSNRNYEVLAVLADLADLADLAGIGGSEDNREYVGSIRADLMWDKLWMPEVSFSLEEITPRGDEVGRVRVIDCGLTRIQLRGYVNTLRLMCCDAMQNSADRLLCIVWC